MVLDLKQKTYLLVTGASRGIGQAMAVQVSSKLSPGSMVVLVARSQEGLKKTKTSIDNLGKVIEVQTHSFDLSNATAEQFQELLQRTLNTSVGGAAKPTNYARAFIIHNAGTLGDVSKRAVDISDTAVWMQYYQMNLFSAVALNCEFFRVFAAVPKLVVNLSSKCGVEPFASMSLYCTVKAARDMYFRVLAEEQAKDTLVLNYAPGAIDTDMTVQLQQETINKELSETFQKQRASATILTTEQTSEEFIKVLEEQKFQSGDHVDYWD